MKKIISMILVLTLVLCGMTVVASAAEGDVALLAEPVTIAGAWQNGPCIYVPDTGLAPSAIVEGGYITVTHSANSVYLVLQDTPTWGWLTVNPDSSEAVEGGYISTFSFDSLAAAYGKADLSDLGNLWVCAGNADGEIVVFDVTWHAPSGEAGGEEEGGESASTGTVLFSGSNVVPGDWQIAVSLGMPSNGVSGSTISAGGYLTVKHNEGSIALAFQDSSDWTAWYQVDAASSVEATDGGYISTFTYDQIAAGYTGNWDTMANLFISGYGYANEMVVTEVVWVSDENGSEPIVPEEPEEDPDTIVLFEGEAAVSTGWTQAIEVLTIHDWGGTFDMVNTFVPGSYFTVTYTGPEKNALLVLMDWEKELWIPIEPITTWAMGNGEYLAYYSYNRVVNTYGTNDFSGVDGVYVCSYNSDAAITTFKNLSWTTVSPDLTNPGTGDVFSIGAAVIATIASGLGLGITAIKRRGM